MAAKVLPIFNNLQETLLGWAKELRKDFVEVPDLATKTWDPAISGNGSIVITDPVVKVAEYRLVGGVVELDIAATFTLAGAGTFVFISLPVGVRSNDVYQYKVCQVNVGGSDVAGRWVVSENGILVLLENTAAWTAGACWVSIQGRARLANGN